MKITEIEKIAARDYSGVDTLGDARRYYKDSTAFKKFSDSDFYYLDNITSGRVLIAVPNTDVKKPTPNGLTIVGVLNVYPKTIKNVYDLPIVEVGTITVDKRYRGQGIANKLYEVVLKSGRILFAGDTQTPGGRAMWSNLYRRPDIEVTGWASAHDTDTDYGDYSFDDIVKFLEQQGGSYFGEKKINYINTIRYYYEFAVEQLPTRKELEIMGKRSPVKVYDGGARSGLLARYVG